MPGIIQSKSEPTTQVELDEYNSGWTDCDDYDADFNYYDPERWDLPAENIWYEYGWNDCKSGIPEKDPVLNSLEEQKVSTMKINKNTLKKVILEEYDRGYSLHRYSDNQIIQEGLLDWLADFFGKLAQAMVKGLTSQTQTVYTTLDSSANKNVAKIAAAEGEKDIKTVDDLKPSENEKHQKIFWKALAPEEITFCEEDIGRMEQMAALEDWTLAGKNEEEQKAWAAEKEPLFKVAGSLKGTLGWLGKKGIAQAQALAGSNNEEIASSAAAAVKYIIDGCDIMTTLWTGALKSTEGDETVAKVAPLYEKIIALAKPLAQKIAEAAKEDAKKQKEGGDDKAEGDKGKDGDKPKDKDEDELKGELGKINAGRLRLARVINSLVIQEFGETKKGPAIRKQTLWDMLNEEISLEKEEEDIIVDQPIEIDQITLSPDSIDVGSVNIEDQPMADGEVELMDILHGMMADTPDGDLELVAIDPEPIYDMTLPLDDDASFESWDLVSSLGMDSYPEEHIDDGGRMFDYGQVKSDSHEGRMTKAKLHRMGQMAQSLHDRLYDGDDLPGWVQDKVTTAEDRLKSAYDYMDYKIRRAEKSGCGCNEATLRRWARNYFKGN